MMSLPDNSPNNSPTNHQKIIFTTKKLSLKMITLVLFSFQFVQIATAK